MSSTSNNNTMNNFEFKKHPDMNEQIASQLEHAEMLKKKEVIANSMRILIKALQPHSKRID